MRRGSVDPRWRAAGNEPTPDDSNSPQSGEWRENCLQKRTRRRRRRTTVGKSSDDTHADMRLMRLSRLLPLLVHCWSPFRDSCRRVGDARYYRFQKYRGITAGGKTVRSVPEPRDSCTACKRFNVISTVCRHPTIHIDTL